MVAFLLPIVPTVPTVAASDPAQQFFLRLATQPTAARKQAYTTLIYSLVSAGVWAKLDALYILAAVDQATAQTNLVQSAGTLSPVAGPTFTANLGYSFSQVGKSYLDTGINLATAAGGGAQFQQNAASMFAWTGPLSPLIDDNGVATGQAGGFAIGQSDGGPQDTIGPNNNGGQEAIQSQVNSGGSFRVNGPACAGFYYGERNAASGAGCEASYFNGLLQGTNSHGSTTLTSSNMLIGVSEDKTNSNKFDPNTVMACGWGANLGSSGQQALYAALNAYMQAVAISSNPVTAFLNRLQTAPSGARQTLYTNLINGLISDGVWQKLDILWVLAAADATTSRTNLVQDRYVAMASSSGTGNPTYTPGVNNFTVDRGWATNGAVGGMNGLGSYLSDPSDPNLGQGNMKYLTNSAHCMIWNIGEGAENTEDLTFNGNHSSGTLITCRNPSNQTLGEINTNEGIGSGNATITGVTTAIGMFTVKRDNPNNCKLYRHTGTPPSDTVQTALQNRVSLALAAGPYTFGDGTGVRQFAASTVGSALTDADEQNLYQRLYTYLHAVGAV